MNTVSNLQRKIRPPDDHFELYNSRHGRWYVDHAGIFDWLVAATSNNLCSNLPRFESRTDFRLYLQCSSS